MWKDRGVGKRLSVEVGVEIVTDAIPNSIGITFFAMVVLAIMKATLVGHGLLLKDPRLAVGTVNIFNVLFFHFAPSMRINSQLILHFLQVLWVCTKAAHKWYLYNI